MAKKPSRPSRKAVGKALILRALTDNKFRRLLSAKPEKALGVKRLTKADEAQIRLVLAAVKGINNQIAGLADELLCATGGCGIAVG